MTEFTSRIWQEEPQKNNPYVAERSFCHGFDVFGDLLGKVDGSDYLLLLLKGQPPAKWEKELLELMFVALANPGPREPSVHAAMCASVGESHSAAVLMAALGVGAGQAGGGHELRVLVEAWGKHGCDLASWTKWLSSPVSAELDSPWKGFDISPGHSPYAVSASLPVTQFLHQVSMSAPQDGSVSFLSQNFSRFEELAGGAMTMVAVAAAVCVDLGLPAESSELLYLWVRLPGAIAHSIDQRSLGYKQFPFFADRVELID